MKYLTTGNWLQACFMWARGCDTQTIADYFNVSEAFIYNSLPLQRKRFGKVDQLWSDVA